MNSNFYKMIKKEVILVFIIIVAGSIIGISLMHFYVNRLSSEYSTDIRSVSKINAIIVKIVPWHGITNVELSNGNKYKINHSRNYVYSNPFFGDNIKLGDSIIKKANSDSLWVKSSKGEFIFIVGEWINKPKE